MELMNIVNNIKGHFTTVKDACIPNNRALTVEETVVKIHNFPPEKVAVESQFLYGSDLDEYMNALAEISLEKLFGILDKDEISIGVEFADHFKKILYLNKGLPEVTVLGESHYLHSDYKEDDDGAILVIEELKKLKEHLKQNPDIRYIKVYAVGNDIVNNINSDFVLNVTFQQLDMNNNMAHISGVVMYIPCHNEGKCLYKGTTTRTLNAIGVVGSFNTDFQIYQHRDFSYFAISRNNGCTTMYLQPGDIVIAFEQSDEMGSLPSSEMMYITDASTIDTTARRIVNDDNSDIVVNTVRFNSEVMLTRSVEAIEWPLTHKLKKWTFDFKLVDWIEAARRNDIMSGVILGNYLDDMMKFSTYLGFRIRVGNACPVYKGSSSEIDGGIKDLRHHLNLLAEKALSYRESDIGYLKFNHVGTGLGGDIDTDFDIDMFFYCNDRHPAKRTCSMQLMYIPCKNNAKPVKTGKCLLSSIRAPLIKTNPDPVVTAAIYEHAKGYEFIIYHYIDEYEEPTTYIRRAPSLGSGNTRFDQINFID